MRRTRASLSCSDAKKRNRRSSVPQQFLRPQRQSRALFVGVAIAIINRLHAADAVTEHALDHDVIDAKPRHVRGDRAAQIVQRPVLDRAAARFFGASADAGERLGSHGPHWATPVVARSWTRSDNRPLALAALRRSSQLTRAWAISRRRAAAVVLDSMNWRKAHWRGRYSPLLSLSAAREASLAPTPATTRCARASRTWAYLSFVAAFRCPMARPPT
jgi:hypothetical protein